MCTCHHMAIMLLRPRSLRAGTTSQPCMGAIVNALAGTDGDTGVSPSELLPLVTFWEQTRGLYRPFESDMRSPSTDVYLHEMPGTWMTDHDCLGHTAGIAAQ